MKVILFGFDGLRPDYITPETMPRLHAFLERNVHYKNSRAVFPTETYVNHPSLFSGFLPERHGLIANAYYDKEVSRKDFFLGSLVDRIEQAERATGGRLFQVPTVTEELTRAGKSCFTVCSNSPGSTRLIAHKASETGVPNISVNGLLRMNEIFHDWVKEKGLPDFSVLWYGEPDHSFHEFGLGAPESLRAVKTADDCFGEILDAYMKEDVQVAVVSDHGHITVKKHFDLTQALVDRGFRSGENLEDGEADFVLLWGYSGNIYTKNPSLTADIARALQEMDEVGMLLTHDRDGVNGTAEGTFSHRLAGVDSSRSGDIRFVLRHYNEKDKHGYEGTCLCAAPIAVDCGIHGGMHPSELSTLMGFGGSAFKDRYAPENTAGVIDLTPTLYRLLGVEPALTPQGKVLEEAFAGYGGEEPGAGSVTVHRCGRGSYEQVLEREEIGGVPYFFKGERVR